MVLMSAVVVVVVEAMLMFLWMLTKRKNWIKGTLYGPTQGWRSEYDTQRKSSCVLREGEFHKTKTGKCEIRFLVNTSYSRCEGQTGVFHPAGEHTYA